jgi:GTP cyclohydrolase I
MPMEVFPMAMPFPAAHDLDPGLDRPLDPRTLDPRTRRAAETFGEFLRALGVDRSDPHLEGTAVRVARMYAELFAGLREGAEPELRTFPNAEGYSQMVAVTGIPFHSTCAHHFLPFFGTAHVAYLPGTRVVGLSKLARVVDFYARRPQVQERMTEQVADLLQRRLDPAGAMVLIQARHLCMEARGVAKAGALTTTSTIRGAFQDERTRQEFLALLAHPR